jgi:hypothetical protein
VFVRNDTIPQKRRWSSLHLLRPAYQQQFCKRLKGMDFSSVRLNPNDGRKRHVVVDTLGLLLVVVHVASGQSEHDASDAPEVGNSEVSHFQTASWK